MVPSSPDAPWQFRLADARDAPVLARLHEAVRRVSLPWLPILHTHDETVAWFRDEVLPAGPVTLAEVAGRPAGLMAERPGWLDQLYLDPVWQRRGLGSAFLALAKARQTRLELWCFLRNGPALEFYLRHGFRIAERTDGRHNAEREPDARLVWSRDET